MNDFWSVVSEKRAKNWETNCTKLPKIPYKIRAHPTLTS